MGAARYARIGSAWEALEKLGLSLRKDTFTFSDRQIERIDLQE
jgi:hypothetical protein